MMIGLMAKSSGLLRGMIYDYESDMWHLVGGRLSRMAHQRRSCMHVDFLVI
jgi:hypothetical protein